MQELCLLEVRAEFAELGDCVVGEKLRMRLGDTLADEVSRPFEDFASIENPPEGDYDTVIIKDTVILGLAPIATGSGDTYANALAYEVDTSQSVVEVFHQYAERLRTDANSLRDFRHDERVNAWRKIPLNSMSPPEPRRHENFIAAFLYVANPDGSGGVDRQITYLGPLEKLSVGGETFTLFERLDEAPRGHL